MSEAEAVPRITRTLSLPIKEVLDPAGTVLDTFRRPWRLATDLANWAQLELALRDSRRTPEMERLPKYDRAALFGQVPRRQSRGDVPAGTLKTGDIYSHWNTAYPASLRALWAGGTSAAGELLRSVERTWIGHPRMGRMSVLWRGEARAALFRFPYPIPVPGAVLTLGRTAAGGRPTAAFPLPGGGRVVVRLADGSDYRRELRKFDVLLRDRDRMGAAKVVGKFSEGRLVGADFRVAGEFDASPAGEGPEALLRTRPDALLELVVDGVPRPWVYNADQLVGVIAAHDRYRYRFAEDLKFEKRWPADKRKRTVDGPTNQSRLDRALNRMKSERQMAAAAAVGYLVRQDVSALNYDDTVRSFLPRWGWNAMRDAFKAKCAEAGIVFRYVGKPKTP